LVRGRKEKKIEEQQSMENHSNLGQSREMEIKGENFEGRSHRVKCC
jgi:hypothetical protein